MRKNLTQRVDAYTQMAKSIAKPSLAAVAALTAADAEAQITYVNPTDIVITKSGFGTQTQSIDIVAGGATEFDFVLGDAGGMPSVKLNNVGGDLRSFRAFNVGAYWYPLALSSGVDINAGAFGEDGYNSLQNNLSSITNDQWQNLAVGTTRFVGMKLNISGTDCYGWVRIQKTSESGSDGSWTIFDWAYDASGAQIKAGQTAALPVELTSFRAQAVGGAAQLTWATATEENNAGFEVQRSEDGRTFENLAFVEGHGTTLEAQDYRFDDKTVRQNVLYYYRLKQVDYDGQAEYSDLVTLKVEGQAQAGAFYPNPAIGGITKLDYQATTAGELLVTVYNINGQAVAEWVRSVDSGLNVLDMNFSALSAGNYFVRLENGADRQYQKLVIE